jgi:hypothetical protein
LIAPLLFWQNVKKDRRNSSDIEHFSNYSYRDAGIKTSLCTRYSRSEVARWFRFKPKIQIWVIFRGPSNGKRLGSVIFGHFEYKTAIWYIIWPFGNSVVIWYIFQSFGKLRREKSGNPALFRVGANIKIRVLQTAENDSGKIDFRQYIQF